MMDTPRSRAWHELQALNEDARHGPLHPLNEMLRQTLSAALSRHPSPTPDPPLACRHRADSRAL